eukprot:TRINITY_DN43551_c0_g1_i1.p1 TRINITY_DN43551_c0_g1~~TRINITY_DN43551_c0_g1_i1.p1  ORF type:complete len:864 (+),score=236.10 TRINITY_DN43551_c0_g1_i1:64-2592(+)
MPGPMPAELSVRRERSPARRRSPSPMWATASAGASEPDPEPLQRAGSAQLSDAQWSPVRAASTRAESLLDPTGSARRNASAANARIVDALRSALYGADGPDTGAVLRALRMLQRDSDWCEVQQQWVADGDAPLRDVLCSVLGDDVRDARACIRRAGIRWDLPHPAPRPPVGSPPRRGCSTEPRALSASPSPSTMASQSRSAVPARVAAEVRAALAMPEADDVGCAAATFRALQRLKTEGEWALARGIYEREVGGDLRVHLRRRLQPTDISIARAVLRRNGICYGPIELDSEPPPPAAGPHSPDAHSPGPRSPDKRSPPFSPASYPAPLLPRARQLSPPRPGGEFDAAAAADQLHDALHGSHPRGEVPVHASIESVRDAGDWEDLQAAYASAHDGDLPSDLQRLAPAQQAAVREQLRAKGVGGWPGAEETELCGQSGGLAAEAGSEASPSPDRAAPADPNVIVLELGGTGGGHGMNLALGTTELKAVADGTPAAAAGAGRMIGRKVVAVDGEKLRRPADLARILYSATANDQPRKLRLTFAAPERKHSVPAAPTPDRPSDVVLMLGGGSGPHGLILSAGGTAVRGVDAGSPAEAAGLGTWAGARVTHVNGQPVESASALAGALTAAAAAPTEAPVVLRLQEPPRRLGVDRAAKDWQRPAKRAEVEGSWSEGTAQAWSEMAKAGPRRRAHPVSPSLLSEDPVWVRIIRDARDLSCNVEDRLSPQRRRSPSPDRDAGDVARGRAAVACLLSGSVVNIDLGAVGHRSVLELRSAAADAVAAAAEDRRQKVTRVDAVQVFNLAQKVWENLGSSDQLRGAVQLFAFQRGQFRRPPFDTLPRPEPPPPR